MGVYGVCHVMRHVADGLVCVVWYVCVRHVVLCVFVSCGVSHVACVMWCVSCDASCSACHMAWCVSCGVCVWSCGVCVCVCSQMQKFMSMSKDDMVVNSLSASFDKLREWPYCVGTPEGIKDQSFLPRHARLAQALAGTSPHFIQYWTYTELSEKPRQNPHAKVN